jgi:predicted transcriptional regulator
LVSLKAVKSVAREAWASKTVAEIMDRSARTVCANHSMALVERELALGNHDYLPVVDPATDQLIGILSSSDVLRARQQARDTLQPVRAKIIVIQNPPNKEQNQTL